MLGVLQIQFMLWLVSESARHGSCMVCRLQTLVRTIYHAPFST